MDTENKKKVVILIERADQGMGAELFSKREDAEKQMAKRLLEVVEDFEKEDKELLQNMLKAEKWPGIGEHQNDFCGFNMYGAWWDDHGNSWDWAIIETELPKESAESSY